MSEERPLRFMIVATDKYHKEIVDGFVNTAKELLTRDNITFGEVRVPGVHEIASAIDDIAGSEEGKKIDGYIALGCFEDDNIGAGAMTGLQIAALSHHINIGNGIRSLHDETRASGAEQAILACKWRVAFRQRFTPAGTQQG